MFMLMGIGQSLIRYSFNEVLSDALAVCIDRSDSSGSITSLSDFRVKPQHLLPDLEVLRATKMGDLFYPVIPREPLQLRGLFSLNNWQGVGLLRLLFVFGWLWALLMMALALIFSIASGDWLNILSSIVLGPLFFLLTVIVLRVLVEVLLSILLVPQLLNRKGGVPPSCDLEAFDGQSQGLESSAVV